MPLLMLFPCCACSFCFCFLSVTLLIKACKKETMLPLDTPARIPQTLFCDMCINNTLVLFFCFLRRRTLAWKSPVWFKLCMPASCSVFGKNPGGSWNIHRCDKQTTLNFCLPLCAWFQGLCFAFVVLIWSFSLPVSVMTGRARSKYTSQAKVATFEVNNGVTWVLQVLLPSM